MCRGTFDLCVGSALCEISPCNCWRVIVIFFSRFWKKKLECASPYLTSGGRVTFHVQKKNQSLSDNQSSECLAHSTIIKTSCGLWEKPPNKGTGPKPSQKVRVLGLLGRFVCAFEKREQCLISLKKIWLISKLWKVRRRDWMLLFFKCCKKFAPLPATTLSGGWGE